MNAKLVGRERITYVLGGSSSSLPKKATQLCSHYSPLEYRVHGVWDPTATIYPQDHLTECVTSSAHPSTVQKPATKSVAQASYSVAVTELLAKKLCPVLHQTGSFGDQGAILPHIYLVVTESVQPVGGSLTVIYRWPLMYQ